MSGDPWLPIIYLRGWAGNQAGVEETVDDPFYGFNTGSTHVRVGPDHAPYFFAFESPVVRLMTDHDYRDAYAAGVQPSDADEPHADVVRRSIWIFRYYDPTSRTFDRDTSERLSIENAATQLGDFIDGVKRFTGAARVILVGHSTGGLIIRCLIQKIYLEEEADAGKSERMPALKHVAKVFTYATPHGGIHFDVAGSGFIEWARDQIGWHNSDDFGRNRMYQYLTPGATRDDKAHADFDPRDLAGAFPPDQFFSLIGTNPRDYGLPKHVVGPQSDGLVQIDSAYVKNAPRAYVHRSHSGRYGIVNSEEGYENMQRFLFGDMRVEIFFDRLDLATGGDSQAFHQAEVQVAVRGLPVLMHDQMLAHHSAISLEWEEKVQGEPIPLFTLFLMRSRAIDGKTCRYAIRLAVHRLEQRKGFLFFKNHLEQIPLWTDNLVVDLAESGDRYVGKYVWRSSANDGEPTHDIDPVEDGDGWRVSLDLPQSAKPVLGDEAQLLMRASRWNTPDDGQADATSERDGVLA
ncbi:MAG TPA: lipase [Actinomycetota bacterium]|nr:lipase [Actinomycetota bacterium]